MSLKVGIYDPYWDTLGGGERYMATMGQCLAKQGCQVDLLWQDEKIKSQLEARLGVDLQKVNVIPDFFKTVSLYQRRQIMRQYDCFIYLSDGSIPFLTAKNNVLHFQVPFQNVKGRSWRNQLKLHQINQIICNSQFTKHFIDQEFGVKSQVIYPPVDIDSFKPGKKRKLILNVSRFSHTMQAKKQVVLIKAFSELSLKNRGWQLVLAGGLRKKDAHYLTKLKRQAKGLPVRFCPNASFAKIKQLYGQAKIFWHAAGFGENEKTHPEKMEHFGIVVVEAMAAGCVPVVIAKGGIPEIVKDGQNGLLWQDFKQLIKKTQQLIDNPVRREKLAKQAIRTSQKFSEKVFCQKINEII